MIGIKVLVFEPQRPQFMTSDLQPFISSKQISYLIRLHDQYAEGVDSVFKKVILPNDPYWDSPMSPIKFMSELKKNRSKGQGLFQPFNSLGGIPLLSGFLNFNAMWQSLTPNPEKPSKELVCLLQDSFGGLQTLKQILKNSSTSLEDSSWFWLVYRPTLNRLVCLTAPAFWTPCGEPDYIPLAGVSFKAVTQENCGNFWNFLNWSTANKLFLR